MESQKHWVIRGKNRPSRLQDDAIGSRRREAKDPREGTASRYMVKGLGFL